EIIGWLSPIDFRSQHATIATARQEGTGGWLFEDPAYEEWESGSGRKLLYHGAAGVGKTVLMSMVIDHLINKFKDTRVAVVYIYLNHQETGKQTLSNLFASVWRQLLSNEPVSSAAKDLYRTYHQTSGQPTFGEIQNLLSFELLRWSKIYIIVDALDEYPEAQCQILLLQLAEIIPAPNLMVTSRPNIMVKVPGFRTVEVLANGQDIHNYVEKQISDLFSHYNVNITLEKMDLEDNIKQEIIKGTHGMYVP
ncbi:hypothetical protein B0H11DRAFT_1731341, partial [Mycena galericulata]